MGRESADVIYLRNQQAINEEYLAQIGGGTVLSPRLMAYVLGLVADRTDAEAHELRSLGRRLATEPEPAEGEELTLLQEEESADQRPDPTTLGYWYGTYSHDVLIPMPPTGWAAAAWRWLLSRIRDGARYVWDQHREAGAHMKIKAWSPAQLGKVAQLIVFLYVRVSLGRDIMDSPEMQERNGELTAKLRNAHIKEVVHDLDESGQDFSHRKVMWMIDQIRKGEAHGIIVFETSRWGRNLTESRQYVKELYDAGGVLISTTQPIDPTTADGLMIMNHFMNMDEHQGNKIGENWVRAHNNRKANKKPHHGREVFGYKRCPACRRSERNKRAYEYCKTCEGVLQPNDDVAKFYAEAFKRYIDGDSFRAIVCDGRARGITTVNGKSLSISGLRMAMDSGFAAGLIRVNDPTAEHRVAGPWEWKAWVRGRHKRIISLGTWMRYVQRRETQRLPEHRLREPSYALSTLLRCGVGDTLETRCMAAMHASPSKKSGDAFRCGSQAQSRGCTGVTIGVQRAERLVLKWIQERAKGEEMARIEMQRSAQANNDLKELRKLEGREKTLKKKIEILLDALLDGTFTKEQVKKKQEELESDIRIVRSRIAIIQESITSNTAPPPEAFAGFLELWPKLTVVEKQKALKVIIDHIVIYKTEGQAPSRLEVVPKWAPLSERLVAHGGKNWDRIRAKRALTA